MIGVPRAALLVASNTAATESGAPPISWRGSSGSPAHTVATAPGSFSETDTLTVTICTVSAAGSRLESSMVVTGDSSEMNRHVRWPLSSSRYDSAERNVVVLPCVTSTTSSSETPRTAGAPLCDASTFCPSAGVNRTWKLPYSPG